MSDPNIYADLPLQTYSLREFNLSARYLIDEEHSGREDLPKFVLSGEVPGDHQVVIDPLRNFLSPDHQLNIMRDYDSIIGITDEIAVKCQLYLTPVSNATDALTTSIHLKHDIHDGGQVSISDKLSTGRL
jgi:hypothetical protein